MFTFVISIFHSFLLVFSQEAVGDTLQELWISYNSIEKLKGITVLAKLKVNIELIYLTL